MENLPFPELVTFVVVDVDFRYEEWRCLDRPRKALYTYLMLKNCGNVVALRFSDFQSILLEWLLLNN